MSIYFYSSQVIITLSFLDVRPVIACTVANQIEFEALTINQASQVRPFLHKLHGEFKAQFQTVSSYFATTGLIKNKVTLIVGAPNSCTLRAILPSEYHGYPLLVIENKVVLARGQLKLEDVYFEKLQVGCNIGRKRDQEEFGGTLGGFVKVGNEVLAMTCHHVVPNECEFTQPSGASISKLHCVTRQANTQAALNQDFSAGSSAENGADQIVNYCRYDYQLLKVDPSRLPDRSFNKIFSDKETSSIKPPVYDINKPKTSMRMVKRGFLFGKIGAHTGFSLGTLFNSLRFDCFVKLEESTTHTLEFAFKPLFSTKKFASIGDSGSWVFVCQKDEEPTLIGMITAVTLHAPYLVFVTPISSIKNHFQSRTGLEMTFID